MIAYFNQKVNTKTVIALLFCLLAVFLMSHSVALGETDDDTLIPDEDVAVEESVESPSSEDSGVPKEEVAPVDDSLIKELEEDINSRQQEIEDLEKKAEEYKKTVDQKEHAAATLSDAVYSLSGQINSLESKTDVAKVEIDKTELNIKKLEFEITKKIGTIDKNKTNMAGILRTIYETGDKKTLELVLGHDNFSDFLTQVNNKESLQKNLQSKLDSLAKLQRDLEEEKNSTEEEKESLVEQKNDLVAQQDILEDSKYRKNSLLKETRGQERLYKKLLSETEEKIIATRQEIFELEDQLRFTVDPASIPDARAGVLSWPTEGVISQYYGCIKSSLARKYYPVCENGAGGFHNALDIAAGLGTKIYAARDGKVVASGNAPYAYGKWMAVEHDNGLVTLYTHMSRKAASVGDLVERKKTLIGYMGSTGISTGPHLHFTVYAPGTFQTKPSRISGILPIGFSLNPLDYL